MSETKRKTTPITKVLKENGTNPTFYAKEHGFNEHSFDSVRLGRRFNKEIVIQLLKDGYVQPVVETFYEKKGNRSSP